MRHPSIPPKKILTSLLLVAFSWTTPCHTQAAETPAAVSSAQTNLLHPRLAAILKNNPLIDASGQPVQVDRLLSKKYIFVYVSGYYCHGCRVLTPHLTQFYNEEVAKGDFEFIFYDNFDGKKESMDKYMKEDMMPWPCLKYNDPAVAELNALLGDEHWVPRLYLLNQDDQLIAKPTITETDYRSWFPINEWLSLHHREQMHWNWKEEFNKKYPDQKLR